MKSNRFSPLSHPRGFTLIELMVALAISMILMAALASIFAQSVQTREKIDRDGQKIETARYSLDTLSEDIRLAGYYGSYSPPNTGSAPADWTYVDPCDATVSNPLPGWNPTASPVQVPFPIFVYEAHDTGNLPSALTDCLDNYRTGTDVLLIRRANTNSIEVGSADYVASMPYLQVSSCGKDPIDTQPFHAMATATSSDFTMHIRGCSVTTPGPLARVNRLLTRIYFIADCDDCTGAGDGIPTLKMREWGEDNPRTVAPGVENMHIELGIDTNDDGATDAYILSNANPYTGAIGDSVAGMRQDADGEDRWEDVVAIKMFLVTRDLQPTRSYTDIKSFVMGSTTLAAAEDAYRRRLTSSTIKIVNMSARREQP